MKRRHFILSGLTLAASSFVGCGGSSSSGSSYDSAPPLMLTTTEPRFLVKENAYFAFDNDGGVYTLYFEDDRVESVDRFGATRWTLEGEEGEGAFIHPRDLATDGSGRVYLLDSAEDRIQVFDAGGSYLKTLGSSGHGPGQFRAARSIHVHQEKLYVADTLNHRIQVLELDGTPVLQFGELGTNQDDLGHPTDLGISSDGFVFVVDQGNVRVQVYTLDGEHAGCIGEESLQAPRGLAVSSRGSIYVVDGATGNLFEFAPDGEPLYEIELLLDHGTLVQSQRVAIHPFTDDLYITATIAPPEGRS